MMAATPMEARSQAELPAGEGWWYEPKWDGFRCLAFKIEGRVELLAKSGKSLARFFPEVVERLERIEAATFGLDGELLAQDGDRFAFEVLQQRLHPAESRIRRLSLETPATFMNPSNTSLRPVARKTASPSFVGVAIVTDVWSNSAGGIWHAMNRFQMSW